MYTTDIPTMRSSKASSGHGSLANLTSVDKEKNVRRIRERRKF